MNPAARRHIHRALGGAILCLLPGVAQAQQAEPFYKTHVLMLGASSDPGGIYDTYTRILARHINRHIPGNPTVVVQNVPAGGGMQLANMIFNSVPKDGTYAGLLHGSTLLEAVYRNSGARFEGGRFAWIGNMASVVDTCVATVRSGVRSIDDAFKREIIVGASGAGAASFSFPRVYNAFLGTKFKVIAGYPGIPDRLIAMDRGELDGGCGITTNSFRTILAPAYRDGKIALLAQAGGRKDHRLPDVANMLDLAKSDEDTQALRFLFAPLDLDRPVAAPPETPPERLEILRRAFDATMIDPDFLDEAKKLQLDIEPMDAAATTATVERLFATSQSVIDRVRAAVGKN